MATRTKKPVKIQGVWGVGVRENLSRFYKMPRKSKNLNYYDNLKLRGEVKLYYYAIKGSIAGVGRGGSSQNNFYKKLKEIKDQNKKVHKKIEGGRLWFNL